MRLPGPQKTRGKLMVFQHFSNFLLCALSGLKLASSWLKLSSSWLKLASSWLKLASSWFKLASSWLKMAQDSLILPRVGPSWPQVGSSWPKLAQVGPKISSGRFQEALLKGLGRVQGGSLEVLGAKRPSWRPQRCQNGLQVIPKSVKNQ